MTAQTSPRIAVIGLGYVGLPLAVEFAHHYPVTGFDIDPSRIEELNLGRDRTLEVDDDDLKRVLGRNSNSGFLATKDLEEIGDSNFYIVTVPTPTDKHNKPDLTPLIKSSTTVGKVLKKGDVVVYESTVYPGVTEDECIPILEKESGLIYNVDFYVGYSPERINPGDKNHTVTRIMKVTSGSTPEAANLINSLYQKVILAGTHLASSIKVAEAAKVIENAQRDINIAFVNELAKIFNRMGIDTREVLEAAGTKWNFLPFQPGLVGGHCIGVDPYYLAQKAQEVGYHPEIILAGRRLNDSMGGYVADEVIKQMVRKDLRVKDSTIIVYGITFKENCPDIRNTRVVDIIRDLRNYGMNVLVVDPWADPKEVLREYDIKLTPMEEAINGNPVQAHLLAVAHQEFLKLPFDRIDRNAAVVYDVKGILPRNVVDARL